MSDQPNRLGELPVVEVCYERSTDKADFHGGGTPPSRWIALEAFNLALALVLNFDLDLALDLSMFDGALRELVDDQTGELTLESRDLLGTKSQVGHGYFDFVSLLHVSLPLPLAQALSARFHEKHLNCPKSMFKS
jgi:hypothetical protein